jgi:hypothetical protein
MLYKKSSKPSTLSHPGFVLPRPLRNKLSNEINKAKQFEKNTALTAYSDKEIWVVKTRGKKSKHL